MHFPVGVHLYDLSIGALMAIPPTCPSCGQQPADGSGIPPARFVQCGHVFSPDLRGAGKPLLPLLALTCGLGGLLGAACGLLVRYQLTGIGSPDSPWVWVVNCS